MPRMTVPTTVQLADGSELSAHDLICEVCLDPLDTHRCEVIPRTRAARPEPQTHTPCPHCGAPHFKASATEINTVCIERQYLLDQGLIATPQERLIPMTIDLMKAIVTWAESLATPLEYGTLASAGGKATRVRSSTPVRKKKASVAPVGQRIEDLVETLEVPMPKSPALPLSALETSLDAVFAELGMDDDDEPETRVAPPAASTPAVQAPRKRGRPKGARDSKPRARPQPKPAGPPPPPPAPFIPPPASPRTAQPIPRPPAKAAPPVQPTAAPPNGQTPTAEDAPEPVIRSEKKRSRIMELLGRRPT